MRQGGETISAIVTLTMNPSVDLFGVTERLVADAKSRCREASREPGGGGINVARNLHRFGIDVRAVFAAGGLNGELLEKLMTQDGLPCQRIHTHSETRQNFAVTEAASGKLYHFVFPGPPLEENEWQECLDVVGRCDPQPDYLVLSGSLPAGVPDDFFGRLSEAAQARGIRVVLDASGPALAGAAGMGTYLMKLNLKELHQLGYSGPADNAARLDAMQKLVLDDHLTEVLIVTLGASGALLVSREGERLEAAPPPTPVVSHVGAGDAFVSMLVYQLYRGSALGEAFRFGVAAAAAAVKMPGNQLRDLASVEEVYRQMHAG